MRTKAFITAAICVAAFMFSVADPARALPPRDIEVRFSVDLSQEAARGAFDPAADQVAVRGDAGELGGWPPPGVRLDREGATLTYSAWVSFEGFADEVIEFKYVWYASGDTDAVVWEESIDNREFRIDGDEPDNVPPGGNGYAEVVLPTPFFDHAEAWDPSRRIVGADLSGLPLHLALGAQYRTAGQVADPYELFRSHGFGLVRLRLWHTPDEPWTGLAATLDHAQALKVAGFELMLDLHYSDTWADPAHQIKPAAWAAVPFAALVDSVYAYTNDVIRAFRDHGVTPAYVQVGNEINPGMLWDDGRVGWQGSVWDTPARWMALTALLSAGISAVRDSLPAEEQPKIIMHTATGGDNTTTRWFFDNLAAHGVDYDVIGLSYYPWWHGTLANLEGNLDDLARTYGKEIQIVETAYPWTLASNDQTGNFVDGPEDLLPGYPATPAGQQAFLRDLMALVERTPHGLGTGVMYWAPEFLALPGQVDCPYENLTLFDFDGNALPGLGFIAPLVSVVADGETDGDSAQPLILHTAHPNPMATRISLRYYVAPDGTPVSLRVYDVRGRLVRTLVRSDSEPGTRTLAWDGRSDGGRPVPAGVYFIRATDGRREEVVKALLVR